MPDRRLALSISFDVLRAGLLARVHDFAHKVIDSSRADAVHYSYGYLDRKDDDEEAGHVGDRPSDAKGLQRKRYERQVSDHVDAAEERCDKLW